MIVAAFLASAALGASCTGDFGGDTPEVATVHEEIIGGATITNATRRSIGLADYSIPGEGCSASMLDSDWAITASHCVDWVTPSNNLVQVPRADGTLDARTGTVAIRAGLLDIAMVKLSTRPSTWPTINHALPTAAPSSLVGKEIDCYGRGVSGYAQPSGVVNDGLWRILSKTIELYDPPSDFLMFSAEGNPGHEVVAWGDSGGPCYVNGQLVGTVKGGDFTCTDPNNCEATTTNIKSGWIAAIQPQSSYLDEARSRSNATFALIGSAATPLQNGWTTTSYNTAFAGYTVIGGTVHLRGALMNPSTSSSATMFTLPPAARPSATVYVPTNLFAASKGRLVIDTQGNVRVEAETQYADATRFTSLDGISFERLTTGHTKLTLQNGWTTTPFGTRPPAVADYGTAIRFEGAMANGTGAAPFTMPAGFRPSSRVYLPVDLCLARKGRLVIEPSGSVTLYGEKAWSDAQCFTSLEGVWFPKSTSGFTALQPLNGWATSPYATAAPALRNVGGIITFEGAITSTGTSTQAFLLQPAFRPATTVYIEADLCGATKGRIIVKPTGEVSVNPFGGTFSNASCFTSLDGLEFGI